MKLAEALRIFREPAPDADPLLVTLCTGFTPLHLQTFLGAHLRLALRNRPVEIATGLFGDIAGSVDSAAAASSCHALAVVLEWQDLDPRLGIRRLGGWGHQDLPDILKGCRNFLARLHAGLATAAASKPLALVLPTLPLPMIGFTPGWEESRIRLELDLLLDDFAAQISELRLAHLISRQELDLRSPLDQRFDVQAELNAGYPYKNTHADVLGEMLAHLLAPPLPKKGLITDLDNTLWAGILGEDGIDGIAWTLDRHAQLHGLYQQVLASLAATGVLIGIASKNEPGNVQRALDRPDIVLGRDHIFPVAAGWGAKSEAIREILKTWNIGPEAVVFVDDSPLELAEVKTAFPEIECLPFESENPASVWQLLGKLRDLFGKHSVSAEDALRTESLRNSAEFALAQSGLGSPEAFLESIQPVLEFSFQKNPPDARALELLNKTNQFNLNGYRFTEADWQSYLLSPETFVQVISYRDKFGPLGKIAVAAGRRSNGSLILDRWVMSCRAFSRRIEHCALHRLFDRFEAEEIQFDFVPTSKNSPLQQFLKEITGEDPQPMYRLTQARFMERCPKLSHTFQEN